ncbi:MAG: hypothetical protein DRP01_09845 [Archaeoglobales archaeon]|nr:MAG: hypothetical protein DRP01_09845 [Archaeoglobales archaeon]
MANVKRLPICFIGRMSKNFTGAMRYLYRIWTWHSSIYSRCETLQIASYSAYSLSFWLTILKEKFNQAKGFKYVFPILLLMIARVQDEMATEEKESEMKYAKRNEGKHKHLNTPLPNIEIMKETKAGRRMRPKGVSAEVVGMARNKENGKAGEGRPEPSPQNSETGELSVEEIEKRIRIAQMEERLRKELERIQREREELEKKAESAKETIFAEMEKKYGIDEKEIKRAFKERERKKEIIDKIIDAIEKKGSKAYENKQFREYMDAWKRIRTMEKMAEEDVKRIAVFMDEARKFLEEKTASKGRAEIHHSGRMNAETLQILKHVKENGGTVAWKDLLRYGKEELGLDTDTFNKRRWTLLTKGYIERDGSDVKLTPKGYARLEEEGY